MPAKQRAKDNKPSTVKQPLPIDVPQLFRINIEVGDLAAAVSFYTKLLGIEGRRQAGSRCYFECGSVTLQVLDVSSLRGPHPAAKSLYFTVNHLEAAYERAKALKCLSPADVHGATGGEIAVRPWGERSFYAEDPWKNPLCFVEGGTVYTG
jgi:catechol 2,3-dioxygenase-like lactoylglutathione lyase family enzyme